MSKKEKKHLLRIIIVVLLVILIYLLNLDNHFKLIFIIPYVIIAYDIFLSSFKSIKYGNIFNEKFLMIIATIGAFFLGEYIEAVAVMAFYQLGELFESISVGKSRKSIEELMNIKPETATLLKAGKEVVIDPEEIVIADHIIVKPGEKIPIDGTIIKGSTTINSQALTGESLPESKIIGDKVLSGSVNIEGIIIIEASSLYSDSTVAKILALVEESTDNKAKIENFITRFAKYYTPIVVLLALVVAFILPLLLNQAFDKWIYRALMFLVVSCPCALVISVPLSFFGGIGSASRQGVLIKGSNYLEVLANVKKVVFDKTGTLTEGNFRIVAIHPERYSKDDLLRIAAYGEAYSLHPIARAIAKAYKHEIIKEKIADVKEISGKGVVSIIEGKKYFIGNEKLMDSINVLWHECHRSGTIIHISLEDEYLGHIVINDIPKSTSKKAIQELKHMNIKNISMLTGDKKQVAKQVAQELDIDNVYAELLPQDKVKIIESMLGKEKELL